MLYKHIYRTVPLNFKTQWWGKLLLSIIFGSASHLSNCIVIREEIALLHSIFASRQTKLMMCMGRISNKRCWLSQLKVAVMTTNNLSQLFVTFSCSLCVYSHPLQHFYQWPDVPDGWPGSALSADLWAECELSMKHWHGTPVLQGCSQGNLQSCTVSSLSFCHYKMLRWLHYMGRLTSTVCGVRHFGGLLKGKWTCQHMHNFNWLFPSCIQAHALDRSDQTYSVQSNEK